MTRRTFSLHPDIGHGADRERVGLAVMEVQTLSLGHLRILTAMAAACGTAIVALGSCQKHGVHGHPFTFDQRKTMIEGVYGDRFRFVALQDIDASGDNDDWLQYVLSRIRAMQLPTPTDCFSGSAIDARWYESGFAPIGVPAYGSAGISTYERDGRRLHVVERSVSGIPSAREIRFMIERRDADWKAHVPAILWNFVERQYPPQLRQTIVVPHVAAMEALDVPVGTRARLAAKPDEINEYKDDGRWRPVRQVPDEKTKWAMEANGREERP